MRNDRPFRPASLSLALAVGLGPLTGCGSGGGTSVAVAPEAQKKTQDMLNNMHKQMEVQHKSMPKSSRKVR